MPFDPLPTTFTIITDASPRHSLTHSIASIFTRHDSIAFARSNSSTREEHSTCVTLEESYAKQQLLSRQQSTASASSRENREQAQVGGRASRGSEGKSGKGSEGRAYNLRAETHEELMSWLNALCSVCGLCKDGADTEKSDRADRAEGEDALAVGAQSTADSEHLEVQGARGELAEEPIFDTVNCRMSPNLFTLLPIWPSIE